MPTKTVELSIYFTKLLNRSKLNGMHKSFFQLSKRVCSFGEEIQTQNLI